MKYEIKDESVKTTVVDRSGEIVHSDSYFGGKLRVRGNATASYLKKPFQVKLTEKADLFGMGSDKTWLLLANYDDQSLLRNSIMYRLGKFLGMQTTDFISVDLFIKLLWGGIIEAEYLNHTDLFIGRSVLIHMTVYGLTDIFFSSDVEIEEFLTSLDGDQDACAELSH